LDEPAPPRRVTQPETLRRGPQLPPLPSRTSRPQGAIAAGAAPAPTTATFGQTFAVEKTPLQRTVQPPGLTGRGANLALALPHPQPVMSPGRVAGPLAEPAPVAPDLAQAEAPAADADQRRDQLRVEPLTTPTAVGQTFPPSPNAGIPSAFGASWGDLFISASLSGADRLRPEADGSLSMGFGLGDPQSLVGVELAYNLLSIREFGDNGNFDLKVHREVYADEGTQVAAAVGLNNLLPYGPNTAGTSASLYGIVTAAHLLQPDNPVNRLPITASVGLGGGSFSGPNSDVGVIAGVGLQVHPQFSVNTAWSGVGLNVGASIVPVPTLPITLNLLYGDIGNNTAAGSVAVLSVGYGFNFGPRF
ncbi:MAG TPA: hypothetical protein VLS96_00740, partial [Nodosilinea sp.]|nr:hypothetical protein [Nodosilinea sp.]